MIKTIHQTWETKDNIPKKFKREWLDSWKLKNPSWEIKWWDRDDRRNLIKDYYPIFLPLFDNYEKNIHRADVFRYFVLHKYGGVYADMDCECLKPINKTLNYNIIFGKGLSLAHGLDPAISNAFMYSIPGHPFWEYVFNNLEYYDLITKKSEVMTKTGPLMLTDIYLQYKGKEEIQLLDRDIFFWDISGMEKLDTAYISHHVSGIWCDLKDEVAENFCVNGKLKLEVL